MTMAASTELFQALLSLIEVRMAYSQTRLWNSYVNKIEAAYGFN